MQLKPYSASMKLELISIVVTTRLHVPIKTSAICRSALSVFRENDFVDGVTLRTA